jgi:hypothetical protein
MKTPANGPGNLRLPSSSVCLTGTSGGFQLEHSYVILRIPKKPHARENPQIMNMKYIHLLILSVAAASLVPSQSSAERTLDSLWPSRFKEGRESHLNEALLVRVGTRVRLPRETRLRDVHGQCLGVLSKKYPRFSDGRGIGAPYYVFKGKGNLMLVAGSTTAGGWITGTSIGSFELILGQSTVGTASARPPMGQLTVIFDNRHRKTFVLPDSLQIQDSTARIYGRVDDETSVSITLYTFYTDGGVTPLR